MEKTEASYQAAKTNLDRSGMKPEDLNWGNSAIVLGFDYPMFERFKEELNVDEKKKVNGDLKTVYKDIKELIHCYVDLPEKYTALITLWVIGTYFHKEFESYPFLFINAMRGSGKTRLCKLLSNLVWNGTLTNNISESVLFRTASQHTILIDECENIGGKEKNTLRELLQGAYKRGSVVKRMKKKDNEQVVEEFNLYTPIAIANIWGMESVLGDRCIPIVLEKSVDPIKTTLIENFAENEHFRACTTILRNESVVKCSFSTANKYKEKWNKYITTLYTTTTNYTKLHNITSKITEEDKKLFNKIVETRINGRHLELFFPLYLIAKLISEEVLDEILQISKEKVDERKEDEYADSKDVTFIDFVAQQPINLSWRPIIQLANEFRNFGDHEKADEWLNSKWVGRALKRLKLFTFRKRTNKGMIVLLDVMKAKERIKMFKQEEEPNANSKQTP